MEVLQEQSSSNQYIVVKLSKEQFGINIKFIDNIVRMQKITRIPKVQKYLKGVINLRGEIVPIMSLRTKMGLADDIINDDTRIIIVKIDKQEAIGIIVDEVKEVVTLEAGEVENVLYENGERPGFVSGVGKQGDMLISLLEINAIISEREV